MIVAVAAFMASTRNERAVPASETIMVVPAGDRTTPRRATTPIAAASEAVAPTTAEASPPYDRLATPAEEQAQLHHLIEAQPRDADWAPAAEIGLAQALARLPGAGTRAPAVVACAAYLCEVRLPLRPDDRTDPARLVMAPFDRQPLTTLLDPASPDFVFMHGDARSGPMLTAYFRRKLENIDVERD